ncbi:hypothetical protein QFC19_002510 [Naganishia cerealis]|uniref:Uncharacterized protein n=1 Tax=Naganishia cerealis TaxID=610337 RepID=A0ACC2W9E5_9TREE|nr:hypothetical protein QFC19_002510 [Naganishia cerealis]
MDEYDDEDDNRSVGSAATSSFPQSANPFLKDSADSPRTSQSPFAASQLFSFSRPNNGLAAISEQQAQNNPQWRSDGSDRESDGEAVQRPNMEGVDSPFISSVAGSPEFRGRGFNRHLIDGIPEDVTHPLLQSISPRATSRPPGDGAPFRRAIQEEDNEAVEGSAHPAADDADAHPITFPNGNGKSDVAAAVVSDESTIFAMKSPRQRRAAALLDDQDQHIAGQSFIAFPTSDNGNKDDPASMASLLSPVVDTRTQPKPDMPPSLLRSRLSSRMSTSGLSSVLLSEVTGPYGMWRSRADTIM